jgi:hypothetical protein
MAKPTTSRIAILGWGSLIWDVRPDFDTQHEEWNEGGPELPLEFSRVSETRGGALTLVIDPENGRGCTVQYTLSKRRSPDDAIADLRDREGTIKNRIGIWFANGSRTSQPYVPETISAWATKEKLDVVVWTGLESNFKEKSKVKEDFSTDAAIRHLQALTPEGKAMAATYIWRAPALVKTPLRQALEAEPWFKPPKEPTDTA